MAETDNESMWDIADLIREEGDSVQFRLGPSKLSALAACVVNHSYCSAQ